MELISRQSVSLTCALKIYLKNYVVISLRGLLISCSLFRPYDGVPSLRGNVVHGINFQVVI